MLKFSELTLPQKKLIKEMRNGNVLTYNIQTHDYYLKGKQFTFKVKYVTAYSLITRNYVSECYRDSGKTEYCINVGINYGKYLNDKNELVGC
jgi:hypothetical protein